MRSQRSCLRTTVWSDNCCRTRRACRSRPTRTPECRRWALRWVRGPNQMTTCTTRPRTTWTRWAANTYTASHRLVTPGLSTTTDTRWPVALKARTTRNLHETGWPIILSIIITFDDLRNWVHNTHTQNSHWYLAGSRCRTIRFWVPFAVLNSHLWRACYLNLNSINRATDSHEDKRVFIIQMSTIVQPLTNSPLKRHITSYQTP